MAFYAAPVDADDQSDVSTPRSLRVTAIVAFIGFLLVVWGLVVVSRPVRTPLQDCGSPAAFLIDGRVHRWVDPSDPPEGVTEAEIAEHDAHPCQERAANRARPAALALIAGLIVIGGAAATEAILRWRLRGRSSARLG